MRNLAAQELRRQISSDSFRSKSPERIIKPSFSKVELREHVSIKLLLTTLHPNQITRRPLCAREDPNLSPDPGPNHGPNLIIAFSRFVS